MPGDCGNDKTALQFLVTGMLGLKPEEFKSFVSRPEFAKL